MMMIVSSVTALLLCAEISTCSCTSCESIAGLTPRLTLIGSIRSISPPQAFALPGETIQIRDGLILIDGKTYIENREFPNITKPGIAAEGIRLGSEEYFVLGDNRNNSEDSRFADVGNIKKRQIYGSVWFIGQPFSRTGFVG